MVVGFPSGRLLAEAVCDEPLFSLSEENEVVGGEGDALDLEPAPAPLGVRSRYSESVVLARVFKRAILSAWDCARQSRECMSEAAWRDEAGARSAA